MGMKGSLTLALAFAGAFFTVGLPYWQIPYAQVSLPDAVWNIALLVVVVLAAIPRVISSTRFWTTTLVVGGAVPAAVMARVVVDCLSDPTAHNLWPFEIILSAGPGLLAAAVGALAGGLLVRRDA